MLNTQFDFFIGIVVALFKSYEPDISTGTPSLKRRMEPIEMIDHQILKADDNIQQRMQTKRHSGNNSHAKNTRR